MYSIVLANDDGPHSEGLLELARRLDESYDLTVVVPDAQRSATGKALTFNRPLRVTQRDRDDGLKFSHYSITPSLQYSIQNKSAAAFNVLPRPLSLDIILTN